VVCLEQLACLRSDHEHPRGLVRLLPLDEAVRLALRASPAVVADHLQPGALALSLSARELEVVSLVAAGLTDRWIGQRLGISHRTVDNHLRRIFAKVGVITRSALAALATREAIVA
jgi:DNA-binding CsgD family transcriptional regulator